MPTARTVQLPSGTIEYRRLGPPDSPFPPVLFIHGLVVDGHLWDDVAELLTDAGYQCWLPTLPLGAHHIPWGPTADRSPQGAASLIREFIAEFDLGGATLVGSDTGGALCQFALDHDPNLVARVVLTNCDAFEEFPPQPFRLIFALLRQRPLLKPLVSGPLRVKALRHSPLGVGLLVTNPDPDYTDSIFDPLRRDPAIRDDFISFLSSIDRTELAAITPRLTRVDSPVSVVWGAADKAFRPSLGRRLAAVFPNSVSVAVPDSRTFVCLDQPQALAEAIVAITARPVPAH